MTLIRWQRLWIVTSLALVVPVAVGTCLTLPNDETIKEAWANAALAAVQHGASQAWVSPSQVKSVLFDGLDNDAVIERARKYAQESYEQSVKTNPRAVALMLLDVTVADEWYSKQLTKLRAFQHHRIAHGGIVWLVLVVLVYAVSRSAAWIKARVPASVSRNR
jgi:hypothetical protein